MSDTVLDDLQWVERICNDHIDRVHPIDDHRIYEVLSVAHRLIHRRETELRMMNDEVEHELAARNP